MTTDWTISSWQELAILVTIVAAVAGVGGGMIRSKLDKRSADDAASDRIIRLIETEADKKVEVVRTEFALIIANMELKHRDELTAMRMDFEGQLKSLRSEHDTYRCELAPVCSWRNKASAPPKDLLAT